MVVVLGHAVVFRNTLGKDIVTCFGHDFKDMFKSLCSLIAFYIYIYIIAELHHEAGRPERLSQVIFVKWLLHV